MVSLYRLLFLFSIFITHVAADDEGGQFGKAATSQNGNFQPEDGITENLLFIPPAGWRNADNTSLPKHVHLMVVGKGSRDFPPSLALASEPYQGSVKDYLKVVKKLSVSKGNQWKNLGSIRTEAGNASLSQTDSQSQWGEIKMMHVILKKDNTMYILTAAALKEEFPTFYKEIFAALRSVRFSQKPN